MFNYFLINNRKFAVQELEIFQIFNSNAVFVFDKLMCTENDNAVSACQKYKLSLYLYITYFSRRKRKRNVKNQSRLWPKTTEKLKKPIKNWYVCILTKLLHSQGQMPRIKGFFDRWCIHKKDIYIVAKPEICKQ